MLVKYGLTSHETHNRPYWGWIFTCLLTQLTVSQALKEDRVLRIRLQSHQVHPTVLQ